MKKRILYIILGVMLFAKVGMGQSISLSTNFFDVNASPINYNCGSVRFEADPASLPADYYNLLWSPDNGVSVSFTYVGLGFIGDPTSYIKSGYYKAEFVSFTSGILGYSSNTVQVTVNTIPNLTSSLTPTSICDKDLFSYSATSNTSSSTTSFSWSRSSTLGISNLSNSGTNIISEALNNTTNGNVNVVYNYTLISNGCTRNQNVTLIVKPTPTVAAITPQIKCNTTVSDVINFSGTVSNTTYAWTNSHASIGIAPSGSGTISSTTLINTTTSPVIGIFRVTPTANSCSGPAGTFTITVNPTPTATFIENSSLISNDGIICAGDKLIVNPTIDDPVNYTYTWQLPGGGISPGSDIFPSNGVYSSFITDVNTNCPSKTISITVTVNALPVAGAITGASEVCVGLTTPLTSNASGGSLPYSYAWSSSAVSKGTVANTGVLTGIEGGSTNITYSVTDSKGCVSTASVVKAITINALPTVTATSTPLSGAVCIGNNATLNGGGAASYTWSGGVTNGTAFAPATTTTYTVTGTDANGCVNTATKLVTVNLLPTVTATSTPLSGAVCIGNNATLNGGGAASYTWSGGVTNGTAFAPATTTTYTVTGTDANGCVNTATKLVTVTSLPTAAAIVAPANKVIVNKTLALTAAASGGTSPYNFIWTPNPTMNYSISGQENAVFNALKKGIVYIKYQVKDANNCEANSADFEITIEPEEIVLVLPNAFTPNGDGINDEFKIVASNLLGKNSFRYFEIYNRNGKLMKRVDNISDWWDGIYNNVIQDMGVYFIKLVKLNKDGQLVADNLTFYLLK